MSRNLDALIGREILCGLIVSLWDRMRIAYLVVEAARSCVGRCRRRSCRLNWRDCRSAQVWRDQPLSRKKFVFLYSYDRNFEPWSHMEQGNPQ